MPFGGNTVSKYLNLYKSSLGRRDRNLMIFGAWFGQKYDDNPRYFFEYVFEEHPEIKAYWITSSKDVYNRLKKEGKPVVMSSSSKARKLAERAGYVLTATGRIDIGEENVQYLGGACYINLWHGIPLKKIMYDNDYSERKSSEWKNRIKKLAEYLPYRQYYVLSTSARITEIYKGAFRVSQRQILQLGQPRNDCFFRPHVNPYKERFGNRKIILYMPTHRNEGKTLFDIEKFISLEEIDRICRQSGAVFLVKKHFYHKGEADVSNGACIIDVTNEMTDTQMLLDSADILITDYSSCYIDYLLLDRPIVFFDFDKQNYQQSDRDFYFDYDEVTPGKKCENSDELVLELERLLSGQDDFIKDRETVRNLFYASDTQGIVSPQIFDTVKQLK